MYIIGTTTVHYSLCFAAGLRDMISVDSVYCGVTLITV